MEVPWHCYILAILSWLTGTYGEEESSAKCRQNAVVMAMTRCQGERHHLSLASQTNNTKLLCRALQQYSDCMEPRIRGCQGPAKMAFDVITSKYAGPPYNCRIQETIANVGYNTNNEANPPDLRETVHEQDIPKETTNNDILSPPTQQHGAEEVEEEKDEPQNMLPINTYRVAQEESTLQDNYGMTETSTIATSTDAGPTSTTDVKKIFPQFDPSRNAGFMAKCSFQSCLLIFCVLLLHLT